MWVSLNRVNKPPVFFGVYYGKQESTNTEEIKEECDKLAEEILEMKSAWENIFYVWMEMPK